MPPQVTPQTTDRYASRTDLDHRLMKAMSHPLRQPILIILNEREASPSELAGQLREDLSSVSYHVKVLRELDCIELVRTEPRRGATEHFYKATSKAFLGDRDWEQLPASVRNSLSASLLQGATDDAVEALAAGKFDARTDRHFTWIPMDLDEEGWAELVEFGTEMFEKAQEIQAASADRLRLSGEKGFPATLTVMGYEAKPGRRKIGSPSER